MSPQPIKAITITSPGTASLTSVPPPTLRSDYILVRPTAVGLNPTDWKSIDARSGGTIGCRVGCDYAGVVEAVGPKVTKPFKPGDRIAGPVHGCNQGVWEDGAFAELIAVKGDLQIGVPEGVSDVEAATLGIGITTVGQGLYRALGLPLPTSPSPTPIPILIYGGSTATGILGIQFAKLSGYRVLTTSSQRNAEYVQSLGADVIIDHREFSTPEKFAARVAEELAGEELTLAWDCVSTEDSAQLCAAALSKEKGGKYACLLPVDEKVVKGVNEKVEVEMTLMYLVFGEEFRKWKEYPAQPEEYEFGKMFWELSGRLMAEGKVKAARQDVNRGGKGLEGVLVGLQEMREGKVSGAKLVYTL